MNLTNKFHLPDVFFRAVANDPYQGGGDITATQLIAPPQQVYLRQMYRDQIETDVSDRLWSMFGQFGHLLMERADKDNENVITEKRIQKNMSDWIVSGQFDRLERINKIHGISHWKLQDFKTTSVWSFLDGVKPEWEQQLNVLNWLCHHNDYIVDELEIIAWYRDWSQAKANRESDYPQAGVQVIKVPMWTAEKATQYVKDRIDLHQEAQLMNNPAPCTDQERWLRNEKWAVMKKGRKSAIKLFTNPDEAAVHQVGLKNKDVYIEHRPGTYTRCTSYCDVAAFCSQNNQVDIDLS